MLYDIYICVYICIYICVYIYICIYMSLGAKGLRDLSESVKHMYMGNPFSV